MNIGILGSGQLGMYLCKAATKFNINSYVFAKDLNDPAKKYATKIFLETELDKYLPELDCFTFENEFFDNDFLKILENSDTKCFPSLDSIAKLKNKYSQKQLFSELNLPSSKFELVGDIKDIWKHKKSALKLASGAYDGKGLLLDVTNEANTKKLLNYAKSKNIEVYQEEFVEFDKELAIQGAFKNGDLLFEYPLVETIQKNGYCKWVVPCSDIGEKVSNQAKEITSKIAKCLSYTGLFAVEFFYKKDTQELYINEVAPRVHNSGHYTMDAFSVSQFEAHLISGVDLSIKPKFEKIDEVFMMNIIGEENKIKNETFPDLNLPYRVYDYGKTEQKKHRKMGHINYIMNSNSKIEDCMTELNQLEKDLWQNLK